MLSSGQQIFKSLQDFANTVISFTRFYFFCIWASLQLAFSISPMLALHIMLEIAVDLLNVFLSTLINGLARFLLIHVFTPIIISLAFVTFGLLAAFGYNKYWQQEEKANAIKAKMLLVTDFVTRHMLKFIKKVLIGALVSMVMLSIAIPIAHAIDIIFPGEYVDEDYDEDFMSTVISGPIVEEVIFRGIILPAIKYLCQKSPWLIKNMHDCLNSVRSRMFGVEDENQPGNDNATQVNEEKISSFAIFASSLIFSAAHSKDRMPYAFVGGIADGLLYEKYDGDLVPCIAEHMTNNLIAHTFGV